ncbi:MAG TPA: peptidase M20, partial [Archangium sp.]|nr:peptidase M20 [Archangium sp.]
MRARLLAALCFLLPPLALAGEARCQGWPKARAARFSAQALKGKLPAERYAEHVRACSLDAVVALTKPLVRFKTVGSELPAAKSPEFAAMGRLLEQWARARGLGFRTVGENDVFELSWGEGAPRLGLV